MKLLRATKLRYTTLILILIVLVTSISCSASGSTEKPLKEIITGPLTITVAHVNDTHSYVLAYNFLLKYNGITALTSVGGYGLLMSAVEDLRSKEKNVLLLHAGDVMDGTFWTPIFEGIADCDAMNAIRFDAMTLGNHEFNHGLQQAANFITRAKFPVLAANLDVSNEPLLDGKVKPYIVAEFEGQKIGIIGLITPDTTFLSYPGKNIIFLDPELTAREYISQLNEQGINKIIIVSHLGYEPDLTLAKSVSGIDIIVGGHSHTFMGGQQFEQLGLKPDMPYPVELTGPTGDRVLIVHAWEYNRLLGEIKLDFDEKGIIKNYSGQPIIYMTPQFEVEDTVGWFHLCPCRPEFGTIMEQINKNPSIKIYFENPEMVKVLQPYINQVSSDVNTVVATADENLYHGRNKGPGPIIADAFLWSARKVNPGVHLALYDSFNIRSDIYKGAVTVNDINTLLPLQQSLVTITLKGNLLKTFIEKAMDPYLKLNVPAPCFEIAGFKMTVDMSCACNTNDRIIGLEVLNKDGNYEPLNMDGEYTIVTTDCLVDRGIASVVNKLRWMGTLADSFQGIIKNYIKLQDLGIKDTDAMTDYLKVQKNLKNVTEERAVVIEASTK
ncbi:MAG: bifunctional metallophosphatase/5'-nucleotidase [Chloroflexi bacterium]|nr:bifunctional metallophosphatase/5'-nucleotidase [Chloroflexota bacterium]